MEGESQHVDGVVEAEELQEFYCLEGTAARQGENNELVGQVDVLEFDVRVAFSLNEVARDLSSLFDSQEEHLKGYAREDDEQPVDINPEAFQVRPALFDELFDGLKREVYHEEHVDDHDDDLNGWITCLHQINTLEFSIRDNCACR